MTTRSQFAVALDALINDTRLFTQREWAKYLSISEAAISQWLSETTIPRPLNLKLLFMTLEESPDVPNREPIEAFKEMAQRPATEVSPKNGRRMLPTVWEYMTRPLFASEPGDQAKRPPVAQEKPAEERALPRPSVPIPAGRVAAPEVRSSPSPSVRRRPAGANSPELTAPAPQTPYLTPTFRGVQAGVPSGEVGPSLRWEEVSKGTLQIGVVGRFGVGKTCLLAHLFHATSEKASAASRAWSGRVPSYTPLHLLPAVETAEDLWGALDNDAGTPRDRRLLLLDGFDEVTLERRDGLLRAITELAEASPQTGIVLTTRPTRDIEKLRAMTWYSLQSPSEAKLLAWACGRAADAVADAKPWDEVLIHVSSCFRERPDVFRALGSPLMLSHVVRLFKKWSVTTCRDADLLDSCLTFLVDEWDEGKAVVRSKTPWTSISSRGLYQWLGGLCYHSLANQLTEFTREQVAAWFHRPHDKAPLEDNDLRLIAECTGVIEPSHGNRWRIVQNTIQEYLAARFVVESSSDATEYLKTPGHAPWVSSVLRFACSITHDATPLLDFVMGCTSGSPVEKMYTLAGMVSQQLRASDAVLEKSCAQLGDLLEESLDGWQVVTSDEVTEMFPEPKWRLVAQGKGQKKTGAALHGKRVLQTVKSVHRTRLSPAKAALSKRLARSRNEVVRGLGESLDYEGYMEGWSFARGESEVFAAEVCEI